MRIIPDQLRSKNLIPFKKRNGRYNIPGSGSENQISMDRVDSDLSPEEQGYIRHFLGYADALIRSAEDTGPLALPEEELAESAMMIKERRQQQPQQQPQPETPEAAITEEPISGQEDTSHKAA